MTPGISERKRLFNPIFKKWPVNAPDIFFPGKGGRSEKKEECIGVLLKAGPRRSGPGLPSPDFPHIFCPAVNPSRMHRSASGLGVRISVPFISWHAQSPTAWEP